MMIILTWWRSFTYKEKIYLRLALMPFILLLIILSLFSLPDCLRTVRRQEFHAEASSIREEGVIRFHVLAHSNSPADQRLKSMVRDTTIQHLAPLISYGTTREEVELLLQREKKNLAVVAQQKLWREGYRHEVKVFFQSIFFPTRLYGEKIYPAGKYKALQLIIGEGAGKNWWCVMFPPLCIAELVLICWGEEIPFQWMEEKDEEKKEKEEGKEKEKEKEETSEREIRMRFKIGEIFRNLWQWQW